MERPIALTSCLYRVWCSSRKADLQRWQLSLDDTLPWDQARPGRDCLSIAIGRMLHAEIAKHQGIHTITCLADLTCFYDHVDLDQIIEPARDLGYPPLHLKCAVDLRPARIQSCGKGALFNGSSMNLKKAYPPSRAPGYGMSSDSCA